MAFERYELWNTHTLISVMREQDAVPDYWLSLLFPNVITSEDEYIDFERIPRNGRKLAPFVVPMAQGRAIYEEGGKVARFKPAYLKPSDPVSPNRIFTKRPGTLLTMPNASPMARYNAIKADILLYHRQSIERTWEWMACKAIVDGKVTIDGDDYPTKLVDFDRAAGQTIVLGVNTRWGDPGISIMDNIQTWMDLMHAAEFGGTPSRLTVGTSVWAIMRKDAEIKALLDTQIRGTDVSIKLGLIGTGEARWVGTLGSGLEVWVYNDYYTVNGAVTPFMDPKTVVLTGPNVQGYRCFGAIVDRNAQFQALPIFPRNYLPEGDVAVEQILTQSSPLMVPINPNATLKATVLA